MLTTIAAVGGAILSGLCLGMLMHVARGVEDTAGGLVRLANELKRLVDAGVGEAHDKTEHESDGSGPTVPFGKLNIGARCMLRGVILTKIHPIDSPTLAVEGGGANAQTEDMLREYIRIDPRQEVTAL